MIRRNRAAILASAVAATWAISAPAQTSKGILSGVARDATGATVSNATVTATNQDTTEKRTVQTSGDGSYRIEAISPGRYTIDTSATGFNASTVRDVPVRASVVTSYDVTLQVGATTSVVTVEANQDLINTDNGTLSGTVGSKEISNLPVFSLSPIELASTVPGVQTVAPGGQFSNGQNFQVNGARSRSNNFLLDGQEINDIGIGGQAFQPNIPDLYDDLTVFTSVASAEFGRSGGGVFNLVTKAGTNTFHGSIYDRYTGSGLNAVPNYLRGTGTRNPRFDQHQIGGTVGGYIIKNKLFGFGGTQFTRYYGTEQIAPVRLPDAAGIATLNSLTGTAAAQVALLNQYTTNNFYLNQYQVLTNQPTTRLNVGVQPGCAANPCFVEEALFQRPPDAQQSPDTQWSYRVDFKPHEADTFYFRYLHDRSSLSPDYFANAAGGALNLNTSQGGPSELGAGDWTHIFSSHFLNELRASETRISFLFAPLPSTLANPAYALPTLTIANFPSLGPGQNFPQGRAQDLYQIQDTFSYTRGRQSLRAGVDIGHQLEKDTVPLNAKGTVAFAGGSAGVTPFGNFLLNQTGPSGSISKATGSLRTDPHVWRSGFFAQDDVKLSSELTVNLGVRYDYTGNPENSLKYPGIDLYNPFQPVTTVVRVANDKNNISPRLGFAFAPSHGGFFGSGNTVIRGAFGIFYDSYFSNFVTNAATTSPNAISGTSVVTTGGGIANPVSSVAAFVPTLNPLASQTTVASNLVNPQTYQYNLGVEQNVKGAVVAIRYVGNRAEKLFASNQLNYFNSATNQRLNTTRGAINVRGNFASSNYNAIQVEASKRFHNVLTLNSFYTFSKNLDNGSEIFEAGDTGDRYAANLAGNGRTAEYGPSAYDHRHYFSVAYVYTPQGFHAANKFADTLLGAFTRNFTFSGVEQFQSGSYSSFQILGTDTNGDGDLNNDRPLLGNASAPYETVGIDGTFIGGTPGVLYDSVAYNQSGAYNPTTADQVHFLVLNNRSGIYTGKQIGRNSYSNPGSTRNDLAIQKGFGTGLLHLERGQFIIRVEAQNLGNHNDRGQYLDTNVLDYGSGPTSFDEQSLARGVDTTTATQNGRSLVLWAKFAF